ILECKMQNARLMERTVENCGPKGFCFVQFAFCIRIAPGPRHFNKEQTPLAIWFQIPTHGFTVALSVFRGTPPAKPLNCKIRLKSPGAHLLRPARIRGGGEPRLSRASLCFLPGDIV